MVFFLNCTPLELVVLRLWVQWSVPLTILSVYNYEIFGTFPNVCLWFSWNNKLPQISTEIWSKLSFHSHFRSLSASGVQPTPGYYCIMISNYLVSYDWEPNFVLLKQNIGLLVNKSLLSNIEQDISRKLYMWHDILAGNLTLSGILVLKHNFILLSLNLSISMQLHEIG